MKRLCTIIFLVSISILACSQTTIRVEGSPALIDLKPELKSDLDILNEGRLLPSKITRTARATCESIWSPLEPGNESFSQANLQSRH